LPKKNFHALKAVKRKKITIIINEYKKKK